MKKLKEISEHNCDCIFRQEGIEYEDCDQEAYLCDCQALEPEDEEINEKITQ